MQDLGSCVAGAGELGELLERGIAPARPADRTRDRVLLVQARRGGQLLEIAGLQRPGLTGVALAEKRCAAAPDDKGFLYPPRRPRPIRW